MGQKKEVKLEDIAEALGVSIVSVSNALNGKKGVGDSLRENVFKKAKELGYQLPGNAVKKAEKNYRIGVVIAERYVKESPSFYMDIYRQVVQISMKKGCLTALEIVDEEKERLTYFFRLFPDTGLNGILMIGEMNPDFILFIKANYPIPMVCVDFYSVNNEMDYIVTDSFGGMAALTDMVIMAGHKNIGFLGTPRAANSIMDRYMGYCRSLEKHHIKENRDWLIYDREENGYGTILDFSLPQKLPTAFVCNCDKTAYCLIDKLEKRGLHVPEDVSVVGYDHSYPDGTQKINLTTYESDKRAMATIGVNTLIKRIEGKGKPEGIRIVEGEIINGNTLKERKEKELWQEQ